MKFGKVLKVSSENMPEEMHDLFLRYKELKKQIKLIPVSRDTAGGEKQASVSPDGSITGSGSTGGATTATVLSPEEQAFINTLNEDLTRFNRYFIEKEEEAVIRLQALCDELVAAVEAAGLPLPATLQDAAAWPAAPDGAASAPAPASAAQAPQGGGQQPAAGDTAWSHLQEHGQQPQQPRLAGEEHDHRTGAAVPQGQDAEADGAVPQPSERAGPSGTHDHHHQQERPHPHRHAHPHPHPHAASSALQAVKSRLVQFHGEMVLLLHWSLLNYAAVVKILKKHDKRTGVLLRAPYLANVLQQPFSSTTIMSRLAKRAEELVVTTTQFPPISSTPRLNPVTAAMAPGAEPRGAAAAAAGVSAAAAQPHAEPGGDASSQGTGQTALGGSSGAGEPPGVRPAVASASEASTLTFAAAEKEAVYGEAAGQPLVGSTMHALETWAALRKNAITPSTVLAAQVDQLPKPAGKRKADMPLPEPAAPEAKLARPSDPGAP